MLKQLSVSKSTGTDNISAKFLKDGADVITTPITYIVNLSIRMSTVPKPFKTARVVPLFKKGDRNMEGNYRPVSILPVVSKIVERVIYDQLMKYRIRPWKRPCSCKRPPPYLARLSIKAHPPNSPPSGCLNLQNLTWTQCWSLQTRGSHP